MGFYAILDHNMGGNYHQLTDSNDKIGFKNGTLFFYNNWLCFQSRLLVTNYRENDLFVYFFWNRLQYKTKNQAQQLNVTVTMMLYQPDHSVKITDPEQGSRERLIIKG